MLLEIIRWYLIVLFSIAFIRDVYLVTNYDKKYLWVIILAVFVSYVPLFYFLIMR